MKKYYYKLVRDRVPEIIKNSGNQCETTILSDEDYQQALRQKLIEEAEEVTTASPEELVKELADLYEVIDTLIITAELDKETILAQQKKRREERGGFQEKIQLISTLTATDDTKQ
ncbi:MazG nucleotide pyrophosphohydrolase [Halothece sp. PCC 7418]|uniref:nucleoside triphosphate pyrophosphohydrolase n=1 Tax=Halothece sp. (strain PCC 7418) TaxID=65093 RepID=UPI0002A08D95|nr:nucleoside triphosphate pyrophosphohydrolase [Halothece sp. PCC 7418]AFZ43346.1 MazG nucleotide pyrophosphohydrolase [Halothece sp. PCC 7418]